MNQWLKTGIFVVVASVCVLLAWGFQPRSIGPRDGEQTVGQVLFEKLTDPLKVHSLEILEADSGMSSGGGTTDFEVSRIDGRWVIPSHQKYPADAEDQIVNAANALIGVETISVATDVRAQHKTFGVVEPDAEKTTAADEGVGKLIVMKDEKGKALAKLIIGKKVADTDDQRFVRRPGQNRVYTASIDEDAFSTKFEDWIELDLLDLSPSDIRKLVIRDYSVQAGINRAGRFETQFTQRLDMTLDWDQDDNKWKVNRIRENRNNRLVETELLDDEELNTAKLNDMKWALDDLKIVDVERKPEGVGADLRANEELLENAADCQNLARRGFFPAMMGGQFDLISSDGEIVIGTEDGVEYVLRFGEPAGVSGEGDESKLNRFLFVTARLDEDAMQPPKLEDLPKIPEVEPAGDTDDSDAADEGETTDADDSTPPADSAESADDTAEDTGDAAETTEDAGEETDPPAADNAAEPGPPAPQGAEGTEGAPGTDSDETPSEDPDNAESSEPSAGSDGTPAETAASTDDTAGDTAEGESDEPTEDTPPESEPAEGDATADDSDTAGAEADTAAGDSGGPAESSPEEETTPAEPIDIEAEQERIVRDNKRKMDEYEEKKKKAEKKIRELNARFADWYFVISDDVYKKIHLSRSDVIKEKEGAEKEGSGLDAFRDLEGGIDTPAGIDTPPGIGTNPGGGN